MTDRKIVDYLLINTSFVNGKLLEGYFLYGNPISDAGDCWQAMVKYEEKKVD